MRGLGSIVLALAALGSAAGQPDDSLLSFHLVKAGLPVPEYTFVLHQGGIGEYTAENAAVPNQYGVVVPGTSETVQRLEGASGLVNKMLAQARSVQELGTCASRRKGLADTGAKTLVYHEAGKEAVTCDYNYSENTVVQELTREFQAMAMTLDMGRKMARDQRFDRLALDADMTSLIALVKGGQALGLEWIRPTLKGLVDDPAVLGRVRTQATKLLASVSSPQ